MRRIFLGFVIALAACGKDSAGPGAAGSQGDGGAAAVTPVSENLPPSDAVEGEVPWGKSFEMAGDYRMLALEPTNHWINALPAKATDHRVPAMIQLDRLYYPFVDAAKSPALAQEIEDAIHKAIATSLPNASEMRLVPTFFGYQGSERVGGVIYLKNGHTLQDVLISQGLARVDQDPSRNFRAAKLAKPLWDYWLACESQARKDGRGFW